MKFVHEAQVLGKDHNDFLLMCMVLVRGITGSPAAGALHRSVCERVHHSALTLGIWSQILPMAKGEVILFRHPADETLTLRIMVHPVKAYLLVKKEYLTPGLPLSEA
jgi:hypothetical protein